MNALRVLVVDDDITTRHILERQLTRAGYEVGCMPSGVEALAHFTRGKYDVVITDLMMPGGVDGIALVGAVRCQDPAVEVLLITANATIETAIQAMKLGAADYLQKPIMVDELLLRLRRLQDRLEIEAAAGDIREAMAMTERCAAERIQELELAYHALQQRLDAAIETLDDETLSLVSRVVAAREALASTGRAPDLTRGLQR